MQVLLANEYGFCFGVERAVEMVENAINDGQTVRALGPLIHNEQEMQRLAHEGVTTISDPIQIRRGESVLEATPHHHGNGAFLDERMEEMIEKHGCLPRLT